jgi:hypothetical protein
VRPVWLPNGFDIGHVLEIELLKHVRRICSHERHVKQTRRNNSIFQT